MKIVIGNNEYTQLKNLSFAPSADLINDRLSIDEVNADIIGAWGIPTGAVGMLKDDNNVLWFSGYIMYAEEEVEGMTHIRIQSELAFLDRKNMDAKMYNAVSVSTAIDEVFASTGASVSYDSSAVSGVTISGYCPEQSARERLQHILFATGLYCKSTFVSNPVITKFSATNSGTVPFEHTFWKPKVQYDDYITKVTVVQYAFSEGTPTAADEYITIGETTYIVTKTKISLNHSAPAAIGNSEIMYDSVMLINNTNSSAVLSQLAAYYFDRRRVELECINNGDYKIGETYSAMAGEDTMCTGYLESCDYSFGQQAKARMVIGAVASAIVTTKKLTISYVSQDDPPGNVVVAKRYFQFPPGTEYEVETEYIDTSIGAYQYVFRPLVSEVTGTMGSDGSEETVYCKVALKREKATDILEIISVDEVNRNEEGSGEDIYYEAEIE